MREKINAICLSHHAAPQYISARPADRLSLPSLSKTEKLYWGTLSHCPPPARCPPPPASAPLTGPRCNPPLFISTSLISHARISEQSAILINVSCFSAPPVQGITQIKKKKGLVDVQETSACARSPPAALKGTGEDVRRQSDLITFMAVIRQSMKHHRRAQVHS